MPYKDPEAKKAADRLNYEANKEARQAVQRLYREGTPVRRKPADPDVNRRKQLKYKYSLSLEQYSQMLEEQGHACAICGTTKPEGRGWHVDHNHDTGAVRSILCSHCNLGLGHFRDNCATLKAAITYLEKHNAPRV